MMYVLLLLIYSSVQAASVQECMSVQCLRDEVAKELLDGFSEEDVADTLQALRNRKSKRGSQSASAAAPPLQYEVDDKQQSVASSSIFSWLLLALYDILYQLGLLSVLLSFGFGKFTTSVF